MQRTSDEPQSHEHRSPKSCCFSKTGYVHDMGVMLLEVYCSLYFE